MKNILLIPHLTIHNANAHASPYTIGFPALTALLGFVHALERSLHKSGFEALRFSGSSVICHSLNLQTYKGKGDYVHSIVGTANPLKKNGERPSFVEEARCHLDLSLMVEYSGVSASQMDEYLAATSQRMQHLRFAGGDILAFNSPEILKVDGREDLLKLVRKVMPGYALVERRELMQKEMENGSDAFEALLKYLKVRHRCNYVENGKIDKQTSEKEVEWVSSRETSGWIVPITTGFYGLTPPGKVQNQRDQDTPHRFAESIVTLGQFIMPYEIDNLDQILWHTHFDEANDLYLCRQNQLYIHEEKING